jgi:predicted protein tyrosine phosphatase
MGEFLNAGILPNRVVGKYHAVWVISVTNSPGSPTNVFEGWKNGVHPLVQEDDAKIALVFDDVKPSALGVYNPLFVYFDDRMAEKVASFISRVHQTSNTKDLLLVNCHAGISRSGAIVTFASELVQINPELFNQTNPNIFPNKFVLELLRKTQND